MNFFRSGALLLAVVAAGGCTSTAVVETADVYYASGPEKALQRLEEGPVRPQDRYLAAMEEAVSLLELGDYEASAKDLGDLIRELEGNGAGVSTGIGVVVDDEGGTYRGEAFERVYMHTLKMADHLALQDVEAAAREGKRALATIAALPCDSCRFPFTRYLAALSFELTGHHQRAVETLLEAVAESPQDPYLAAEADRLTRRPELVEEAGFAPPPAFGDRQRRVLYVLLLLGRGPQKVESAAPLPPSHAVTWPSYVPRRPIGVVGAELLLQAGDSARSRVLTDMDELARASLSSRTAGVVGRDIARTVAEEAAAQEVHHKWGGAAELVVRLLLSLGDRADLRHWSSLPATCQVLRVRLPDPVRSCELVYLDAAGQPIDRERLDLPPSWVNGPLFVVRRMP